jgi:hypothetical protein
VYVHLALFTCARRPAVTVTLEAGGADTDTQRAIPGSEPSQGSCTFRLHADRPISPGLHYQLGKLCRPGFYTV